MTDEQQQPNTTIHGDNFGPAVSVMQDGAIINYTYKQVIEIARTAPADPQTIAAADALLAQLPTAALPAPASLPDGSRMPLPRYAEFVGRQPDLVKLATTLRGGDAAAITPAAAATAPGGYGKTSLAVEFVHRYGAYFAGGVYWLACADPESIAAEVAECGGERAMQLRPDFHTLPLPDQCDAVLRAWENDLPRLIVCDNVDSDASLAAVQQHLPKSGGCRVLITSRRATWDGLPVQALPLGVLHRAESVALLRALAPRLSDDDAAAIAADVGDLPLALHLAGSYLAVDDSTDVGAYRRELQQLALEHESMQGADVEHSPTQHELSVAATFTASYRRLRDDDPTDPLARQMLLCASYFAPGTALPIDVLQASLQLPADSPHRLPGRALRRLLALGLLEGTTAQPVLHRLLATYTQQQHSDDTRAAAQGAVEQALIDTVSDLNKKGIPAPLLPLLPHMQHATTAALQRGDTRAATMANNLGYALDDLADYAAARPLYQRALAIREQQLGATHPDTATSLNNLAGLLEATGDYEAARPLYQRALAIYEEQLGEHHPWVATSLNNLAGLLEATGDYEAARPLYQRAIAIREQVQGKDHPDLATNLNNLAGLLEATGDYAAARPLSQRALAIREQQLGATHPATAQSLNNLAGLLHTMGESDAALPLLERALAISKETLGDEHPDIVATMLWIATIYQHKGDYAAARPLLERALAIREQQLGATHPDTATSLNNLAALLRATGDYAAARPLYERAIAIREQVQGKDHPDTAQSLNNLAGLLRATGDYAAARPLLERALAIREQQLGATHPATATSLNALALLHYATGDYAAARPLLERALAISEQQLGATHPATASSLNNLAVCLEEGFGDYAVARPLYQRALAIREQQLGATHPDTALSLNNLAMLLEATGDYAAARPLYQRALAIFEATLGSEHPSTRTVRNNYEDLLRKMGK